MEKKLNAMPLSALLKVCADRVWNELRLAGQDGEVQVMFDGLIAEAKAKEKKGE